MYILIFAKFFRSEGPNQIIRNENNFKKLFKLKELFLFHNRKNILQLNFLIFFFIL